MVSNPKFILISKKPYCSTSVFSAMQLKLRRAKRLGICQRLKCRVWMVAESLRPEHGEEHCSKPSLLWCPEQPWLKAQVGQDGSKTVCSMEERQLPSNTPFLRREIPHISFPDVKGGQSSATCKQCQVQFGFYMDECKYRRSMYSKALIETTKKSPKPHILHAGECQHFIPVGH